jgi:hypothetical protein
VGRVVYILILTALVTQTSTDSLADTQKIASVKIYGGMCKTSCVEKQMRNLNVADEYYVHMKNTNEYMDS